MLLQALPPELIRHVLVFLSSKELVNSSRICKGVAEVADNVLRARFWASVVDRRAGQILVFEASRPSDYRTSCSHQLSFSHFVDSRLRAPHQADAPTGVSRARFLFSSTAPGGGDASVFFTLDDGEHFQTFLLHLILRTGSFLPTGSSGSSEIPQNARLTTRHRVGPGLNYTIESSTSGQAVTNGLLTTGRLRSDVSIFDGLERVWRHWFDPSAPVRKLEMEGVTTTVATFPSLAHAADGAADDARLTALRFASSTQAALGLPVEGQRLFELAWRDLECDIGRVMVAIEDAEHAQSRAIVLFSSASRGMVPFAT